MEYEMRTDIFYVIIINKYDLKSHFSSIGHI